METLKTQAEGMGTAQDNFSAELTPDIQIEQTESLKLIRNSQGYNWEIEILEINPQRIEVINNEMEKRFGSYREELKE